MLDIQQDLNDLTVSAEEENFKVDVFYVIVDSIISRMELIIVSPRSVNLQYFFFFSS